MTVRPGLQSSATSACTCHATSCAQLQGCCSLTVDIRSGTGCCTKDFSIIKCYQVFITHKHTLQATHPAHPACCAFGHPPPSSPKQACRVLKLESQAGLRSGAAGGGAARRGHGWATAALMVPLDTGVLRQSTAGLMRFMSMRSLYCARRAPAAQHAPARTDMRMQCMQHGAGRGGRRANSANVSSESTRLSQSRCGCRPSSSRPVCLAL